MFSCGKEISEVVLKVDFKELQYVLTNKHTKIDRRIRPIVLDIQSMLNIIPEKKVNWIKRDANAAANWVAVNTRKGMCQYGWARRIPSPLVGILDKDGLLAPP